MKEEDLQQVVERTHTDATHKIEPVDTFLKVAVVYFDGMHAILRCIEYVGLIRLHFSYAPRRHHSGAADAQPCSEQDCIEDSDKEKHEDQLECH